MILSKRNIWLLLFLFTVFLNSPAHAFFSVQDHVGNTAALTDESETVIDEFRHSPYGTVTYQKNSYETPFRFGGFFGVQTDSNGLVHMRARYYNPLIRRFINSDPARDAWNWFAYASGNPVSYVDPSGLEAASFTGGSSMVGSILGTNEQSITQFSMQLPDNPSGLGPEWTHDPTHLHPNGERFRDPSGRLIDWHPGQEGRLGWRGKDHWHDPENFGGEHLLPGREIPDPAPANLSADFSNVRDVGIAVGTGVIIYIVVKKAIGTGLLFTPAAPVGGALILTP